MIKLDQEYSDFLVISAPGYPFGKAIDSTTKESVDGTPYKAVWMNDINGTRQAIIKYAYGNLATVSGVSDTADNSDVLNALLKIIENIFGRVPTVTRGPFVADIDYARRYQVFFIGDNPDNARLFLPDISGLANVDVVEIEVFNQSNINLKIVVYPESELITLPPGGCVRIRPYPLNDNSSAWGHTYHYKDVITPLAPVKYDSGGRLKAARPVAEDDVLRLGDWDLYVQQVDFTEVYQAIYENRARIEALENGAAQGILRNPFVVTFAALDGIILIEGTWDKAKGRLDCSYAGGGINISFTTLNNINLISGIWVPSQGILEC